MLSLALIAASLLGVVSAYPITGNDVHCRTGPGTGYSVVKTYPLGHQVEIECQTSGTNIFGDSLWDKTKDGCYVADYYIRTGTTGYVTTKCGSSSSSGGSSSGSGKSIISAAEKEKGIPYVYGGGGFNGPTSGGFDCSGLTRYSVYKALGKKIPRVAQDQYNAPSHGQGKRIARKDAKPGDLLFWGTNGNCGSAVEHTGIFISSSLMINAAHPGTVVREQAMWTSYGGLEVCPYVVRFW